MPEEEKPAAPVAEDGEAPVEKKPAKRRAKKENTEPESEKEWSEDTSNNPFAALLKDIEVK